MLLGVDVGGTFTDAVLLDGDRIHTAKTPTTPDDQSQGVIAAIDAVLEKAEAAAEDVKRFAHGMTVGTNALLEERGARTALLATAGFEDTLEIARQNRPSLYHLCAPKPVPLVPHERCFGVDERVGPEGVVTALEDEALERAVEQVAGADVDSVAICLLFSYLDPSHESKLADALRAQLPNVHVSVSHELLAEFREYERCSTVAIDAYLSPLLASYLSALTNTAAGRGLPEPVIMRSSGGLASAAEAARAGAWSVLSGPAGGAVGAVLLAGTGSVVGLDMGGTSCDVCVVEDGEVRRAESRSIAGRPLQLPMVDVHTVGAGGGSIAWRDSGGALRVGPRSAGADPGPACYGRGGTEPTVTDANLLLGYLPPGSSLAGGVELDEDAAHQAVNRLGSELGLEPTVTAEGIVRIANQEMVRALRVMTVERGVDPREFALLPFGGAGPLHAAALADELGMQRILCPRAGGVLSALGLVASERRRDAARTLMLHGDDFSSERVGDEVDTLRETIADGDEFESAELSVVYDLRYRGQSFELPVAGDARPQPDALVERFAAEHERRYGYRDPDAGVELVTIRVALTLPGPRVPVLAAGGSSLQKASRKARFEGTWSETVILRGEPAAGHEAAGPCVYELPETTLVIPPGWQSRTGEDGSIEAWRS